MGQDRLQGQTAVVTGASSGAGRATALALAQAGAQVVATARRAEPLQKLAAQSSNITAVPLDVTDRAAVDRFYADLRERTDRLDILVCAAGINITRRRFHEISLDDWHQLMETNVSGTFHAIQSGLGLLRAARGLVIVIGSISGRWPDASGPAYQASKRAVLGLAHAVSLEEQRNGIRVSAVLPGVIDTPLLDKRPQPPSPEDRARALRSEDIADICVFLAGLDPRVCIPELVVVPSELQRIGTM